MKFAVTLESKGNISIKVIYKTRKEDIDYVKMIKEIYEKGKIEEVQFSDDIPEKERTIITAMVEEINRASLKKKIKVVKE